MSSANLDRIRELTAPMWRKKLYALTWDGHGANLLPHLAAHLEYMIGLEKAGKIFASGPLDFGASSDGLTVFNVASKEEAALAVLELSPPVTWAEVRARYKALVKRLHPDANGGDTSAEEQLKLVNQAYGTLKAAAAEA